MSATSQSVKTLTTYVCGDSGTFDEFNPSFVMRQKWATELLYLLNKHPVGVRQISSILKTSEKEVSKLMEDLVRLKAVEEKSGVYHVTFSIFTRRDMVILKQATEPIAVKLSDSLGLHTDEITSLVKNLSSIEQVGKGKLLFAALGCFVLDWMGLKVLEKEGLLAKNKPQPGNRSYLLFARENVDRNTAMKLYDRMYWGSHSDKVDKFVFTSFGDHCGIRYVLPDILWAFQASPKIAQKSQEMPSWMVEKTVALTGLLSKKLLKDAGLFLLRLNAEGLFSVQELDRENEKTWTSNLLHLLEDMNYIIVEKGMLRLNYPVFAAKDKKIIEQLGNLVIPLITKVMRRDYSYLERALSDTTSIKNKIELGEVLNEAWHWIFAQTNKILAERGFLYDPPRKRVEEARYIAWVREFDFQ